MVRTETLKTLEKRYHCHIERNGDLFDIFSLDGCHWSLVGGYRSLLSELKESKDSLRRLANLKTLIAKGY